jgi:hypothetical protein
VDPGARRDPLGERSGPRTERATLQRVDTGPVSSTGWHFRRYLIGDKAQHAHTATVIPAHAGIHWVNAADRAANARRSNGWIPAFAGMTMDG